MRGALRGAPMDTDMRGALRGALRGSPLRPLAPAQVKQRILQFLAVCLLRGDTKGSIMCMLGPPGIGKSSAAGIVARELGFEVRELNASDTRSKRSLAEGVADVLSTRVLSFGGAGGQAASLTARAQSAKRRLAMVAGVGTGAGPGPPGL